MNTTIRNRAAGLGIATIIGFAGVAVTDGTALASPGTQTAAGDTAATAASAAQSTGHPSAAADYADELVRAWGTGSDIDVGERAAKSVVDALDDHGDAHVTQWDRVAADADSSWTRVVYTNRVTAEMMTVTVANKTAADDEEQAVRSVEFDD
ncbi:hypothetical protein [Brevibacterium atlanticum]|uniref:hypothetical protein n=1 Tax=Brevibacterium atlanticum TaxID=2697563 RepID=UPI001423B38D|nr:hypothetical protein [Brevibacterium atlanticum]